MYFTKLLASLACALVSFNVNQCAIAQDNPQSERRHVAASHADIAFVQQAAKGGIAEIELSQLAVTSGTTPELRTFAQKMVDDHSASNRELASAASSLGISVPKESDQEHIRLRQELSTLRGPNFDKMYIEAMRRDHEKMVELLQSSAKTVRAPELRSYIDKTLPVVRQHMAMVQKLK